MTFDERLIPSIQQHIPHPIRVNCSGRELTTMAVGGSVSALVTVHSERELTALMSTLSREGQSYFIVGNGSNLVISDEGYKGWMIKLGSGLRAVHELPNDRFGVSGGASLMSLSRSLSEQGLSGLEFAAGIPATVGGATVMNAGAHGAEVGERIVSVRVVHSNGELHEYDKDQLTWGYRHSSIPSAGIVTHTVFQLVKGEQGRIADRCRHFLAERKARQPLHLPSSGSIFKNPTPTLAAGVVLERAGMKGARIGGAHVSDQHANWIVNPMKRASAQDIVDLLEKCRSAAQITQNITLDSEVRLLGAFRESR